MIECLSGEGQHISGLYALDELPVAFGYTDGVCSPIPYNDLISYYTLGAQLPWSNWPALTEAYALPQ